MPLAITQQGRVGDLGSALAEVKHEVQVAVLELECGVVHLVLMSHVVNKATGGKRPDPQLYLEPEGGQHLSTSDQEGQLPACNVTSRREPIAALSCAALTVSRERGCSHLWHRWPMGTF